MSLLRAGLSGGFWSLFGQGLKIVVLFANVVILGRLLAPEDFGLFALAFAVVGVADLLRDFGLSAAAVQAESVSRAERSNLFWINGALGLVFGLLAVAAGPVVARLFDEPRLALITASMGLVFFFNGLQVQYQADLYRSFRFRALAVSDVVSSALGLAAGIAAALAGLGYWSLVLVQTVAAASLLVSRVWLGKWVPRAPSRHVSVRRFVRFGLSLGGSQFIGFVVLQAPLVLAGAVSTVDKVGYLSRAFQVVAIPINQVFGPLTNVVVAVISRVDRQGRTQRASELARAVSTVGVLLFLLLVLETKSIVTLLLGAQWQPASGYLAILALGGMFQSLSFPAFWFFVASGRTGSLLRYTLVSRTVQLLLTCLGAFGGIQGVLVGYVCGFGFSWLLCTFWLRRAEGFGGQQFKLGVRLFFIATAASAGYLGFTAFISGEGLLALAVRSTICVLCFGLVWLVTGGVKDLRSIRSVLGRGVVT